MLHACTGCGGSCETVRVRVLEEEVADVLARAEQLGVGSPLEAGVLRQEGGRCVFLDGNRCRIHAAFGADAKPAVCQQYPLVRVRIGGEVREGIDPGCYAHAASWRDGPPVSRAESRLVVSRGAPLPAEGPILQLLAEAPGVGAALSALVGEAAGADGLPRRFVERLRLHLGRIAWSAVLDHPHVGPALRAGLEPLSTWTSGTGEPLGADRDRYGLDVAHRTVRLQIYGDALPSAPAVALLTLAGAAAAGLAAPDRFGPCLAAWTRALRAPFFRSALLPDVSALRFLAEGDTGAGV